MNLKTLLFIFTTISSLSFAAYAESIEVDGINYNITDNKLKTCEVTSKYISYKGDITIPDSVILNNNKYGVTSIGAWAFNSNYQIRSITFPKTLKIISDGAFNNCTGLIEVSLPSSLDSIGEYAFAKCSQIWKFTVEDGNKEFSTDDTNALFNSDKTKLYYYPAAKGETDYTVPSSVTEIGAYAFQAAKSLQSIQLPEGIRTLGKNAFSICVNLSSIKFPEGLQTINDECFSFCYKIESVHLPKSLEVCGIGAFKNCTNLASISVGEDNKYYSVKDNVLYGGNNILHTYPAAKKDESFTMQENIDSISYYAFSSCSNLKRIDLSPNVVYIGAGAFSTCDNLESISIPKGVSKLLKETFWSCASLKSITLNEGLRYIGSDCFSYCTELKTLEVPKSVTQISGNALINSGIAKLRVLNPEPPYLEDFDDILLSRSIEGKSNFSLYSTGSNGLFDPAFCELEVPQGSLLEYKKADNWNLFSSIKEIIPTVNEKISLQSISIVSNGNEIVIKGEIAGKLISVYSITGSLLINRKADSNEVYIPLNYKGLYIIKIGTEAFKVKI